MALVSFVEKTDTELLSDPRAWRARWPKLYNEVSVANPETPFVVFGIVPSQELNESQVSALKTLIEAISGGGITISAAIPLFNGKTPSAASIPANHDVYYQTTSGFKPRPTE